MEKRYKIEKLEKYSEEWRESKDYIEKLALIGALSLAAVVAGIGNYGELLHIPNGYATNLINISSALLAGIGVPTGCVSIKELIRELVEKVIIENKIDEMNEELDLLEEQVEIKTRGRR